MVDIYLFFVQRDFEQCICFISGVKSRIGNYRDNRFNGLFQTAAEVLVHAEDMIEVLSTVKQPNKKLIAVKADLQCEVIRTLLQCFALFYVKVTGPYWNLVTSGEVPYLCLYSHIQTLADYLKTCSVKPEKLLSPDGHWESDDLGISHVPGRNQFEKLFFKETDKELLHSLLSTVSGAMLRCIEKQLEDFLPGGQFSASPSSEDLRRTGYSHATNLGCEHHFGDLDSSQKRRPNASLHHHSSVQLLKRNRNRLMEWLTTMSPMDRTGALKDARKGGKSLRQKHLQTEKDVMMKIHQDMTVEKEKKGKKRKRQETDNTDNDVEEPEPEFEFVECDQYSVNEYVAVAYQDKWYPGVVEKLSGDVMTVNFMESTRNPGYFTWPARKDVQQVSKEFIIFRDFVPACKNSGRLWHVEDHVKIQEIFQRYSKIYF